MGVKFFWWCLIGLILLIGLEVFSYAGLNYALLPRASFLSYRPPTSGEVDYQYYLRDRDSEIGWPGKQRLSSHRHDVSGSRLIPAFPEPGSECVSLYGDSFTYSEEVDDLSAWGNILSIKLGCRVSNFGIGGYGTDQAYLRFRNNAVDRAPISLLGIYPTNLLRNVNQHRYLQIGAGYPYSFKPRFVLQGNDLLMVPIPTIDESALPMYWENPERYLTNEYFTPDSAYGGVRIRFPYIWSLFKVLTHNRLRDKIFKGVSWISFLSPNHPSKALNVTVEIANAFVKECKARDKQCAVVLYPSPSSFTAFKQNGSWSLEPLAERLRRTGIATLHVGQYIAENLGNNDFCKLLTNIEECRGHFNANGNQMVADAVHVFMVEAGLVSN